MSKSLPRNIPALTGVRGAAALMVVAYHYSEAPSLAAGHLHAFFSGYLGVDLFFVLSGFLMGHNYGRSFERGFRGRSYLHFLEKRFARVYPLYAVFVIAIFVLSRIGLFYGHIRLSILATNLLLVQQLGPGLIRPYLGDSIVDGSWSISTELGAYLLFPALYFLACRSRSVLAWTTAVISAATITLLALLPAYLKLQQLPAQGLLDLWSGWSIWPVVRCLSEFTIGLAVLRWVRTKNEGVFERDTAGATIMAGVVLSVTIPSCDPLAVLLIALLVAHLAGDRSALARALGSRIMIFLGEVSYALYLLHLPVLEVVFLRRVGPFGGAFWRTHQTSTLLFSACLSIALAYLAFRLIEFPARNLLRSLASVPGGEPIVEEPAAP